MTADVIENQVSSEPHFAISKLSNQAMTVDLNEHRFATAAMQPGSDTSKLGFPVFDGLAARDSSSGTPKDRLLASLTQSGVKPEGVQEFKNNLEQFEANAAQKNLTPAAIAEVYKDLGRILDSKSSVVPSNLRTEFVTQWASKLADPTSVKQGWHDSCGMGFYQTHALMNNPQAMTKTMADVLTKGAAQVPDDSRSRLGMWFFNRPENPSTTRPVKIDPGSLKPDFEAQGKSIHPDARDYADQVAQVTLNTLKWDMKEKSPSGWTISQGSMKFKQCEDVQRPSDNPSNKGADKSCELVEETGMLGSKTVHDGNGYGFGGESSAEDIDRVQFAITGERNLLVLDGRRNSVGSPEELESLLKRQKNFPVGVFITPNSPEFAKSYLARHPDKTEVPSTVGLHIVGVSGFNPDGTIKVVNPWGTKHALTAKELFEAMQF